MKHIWKVKYSSLNPSGALERRLVEAASLAEALKLASENVDERFTFGQVHVAYVGEMEK